MIPMAISFALSVKTTVEPNRGDDRLRRSLAAGARTSEGRLPAPKRRLADERGIACQKGSRRVRCPSNATVKMQLAPVS
jgi:hypothetical protein